GEGVLHGAGPATSGTGALRGCARARGLRRNHRWLTAYGLVRVARETYSRARASRRVVQVVSRLAEIRRRAARGLWHGNRTGGGMDLRIGARARDNPIRQNAAPVVPVTIHRRVRRDRREQMDEKDKLDQITRRIIGCAIEVHKTVGPGLLESAYQVCLAFELRRIGLAVEEQKTLPVVYKEVNLDCGYRMDLVVED